MTDERMNNIVQGQLDHIQTSLVTKAKEYQRGPDRLHNFKVAGRVANTSPAKALKGMALKHEVSIMDLIEDSSRGIYISEDILDEKFGDAINYLILLKACLIEANTECVMEVV